MSNQVNDDLLELAHEHIEYWAGEGVAKNILFDIQINDLDKLRKDLEASAKMMFDLEYNPDEVMIGANDVY
jgi:hypothetical protein